MGHTLTAYLYFHRMDNVWITSLRDHLLPIDKHTQKNLGAVSNPVDGSISRTHANKVLLVHTIISKLALRYLTCSDTTSERPLVRRAAIAVGLIAFLAMFVKTNTVLPTSWIPAT